MYNKELFFRVASLTLSQLWIYKENSGITGFLDFINNALRCSFFFYLFTNKSPQDFLWGFVREQVEEEATAQGIVDKIKKAGDTGIFFVDSQLGQR